MQEGPAVPGDRRSGLSSVGSCLLHNFPPAPDPILSYFWQVGQEHSGSMGRKSF